MRGGRARCRRARAGLALALDKLGVQRARRTGTSASAIAAAGGECLLDMRVRTGGSHHQKFVVLRHPGRPGARRRVRRRHRPLPRPARRRRRTTATRSRSRWPRCTAPRPPWHDVQVALRGPVVGDVETVFRERWEDPQPLTRNPVHWLSERVRREDRHADPLPPQLPDPAPVGDRTRCSCCGPTRSRLGGYPFAPDGERSVARGYTKALRRAGSLVYVEDQYLWSTEVARTVRRRAAGATAAARRRRAAAPPRPGRPLLACRRTCSGRDRALSTMRAAGGDRVAVYGIENPAGTPVYVHAKVCIVDDTWATIGSDNFNRRSWTHDSELTAAVLDDTRDPRAPRDPGGLGDGARTYARDLRLQLLREHLDRGDRAAMTDLVDPRGRVRASCAVRPRRCSLGTTAAASARARRAGCDRWSTRDSRRRPSVGPRRPTTASTTRTAGRPRSAADTPSSASRRGRYNPGIGRSSALPDPLDHREPARTSDAAACVVSRSRRKCSGTQQPPRSHALDRDGRPASGQDVAVLGDRTPGAEVTSGDQSRSTERRRIQVQTSDSATPPDTSTPAWPDRNRASSLR